MRSNVRVSLDQENEWLFLSASRDIDFLDSAWEAEFSRFFNTIVARVEIIDLLSVVIKLFEIFIAVFPSRLYNIIVHW